MNEILLIGTNKPLIIASVSWLLAQVIKSAIQLFKEKKFNLVSLILATGGFPSSHASFVTSLATSIGLKFGFDSGVFSIATGLALVVISDARGIRQQASKQAQILNKIIEDLYSKKGFQMERLRELLGHTGIEVFAGSILGVLIAILLN
ncbi:MAG: divergent PAP2 family protein [Patescibacteria group bacterium]